MFFSRLFRRRKPQLVTIDDDRITVRLQGKPTLTIAWAEIEEITLVKTSAESANKDYWYILDGMGENRVLIPSSESEEFLRIAMQKLQNFDLNRGALDREAQFVVWKREN